MIHIGGVVVTLAIPLFIGWISPDIASKESLCPVMRLWHFPCPGCGITKSVIFLYRGDVSASLHYHPFGIVLVIVLILFLLISVIDMIVYSDLFGRTLEIRWIWQTLAVSVFVMWLIKLLINM